MKRLKIQFTVFFLLLAGVLAFLLFNSYRQMAIEERGIWVGSGERVYNQMQAAISEFLNREDERSFSEYRYYQALPGTNPEDSNLSLSPLSSVPEADPKGLLGFFQIDSDGTFSTPYLPVGSASLPKDSQIRKAREQELKAVTQSLKIEVFAEGGPKKDDVKPAYVQVSGPTELDKARSGRKEDSFSISKGDAKNIYPNPVQKQKESLSKIKMKKDGFFQADYEDESNRPAESPQLARRQLAPNAVQSKAFEEQKALPENAPAPSSGMLSASGGGSGVDADLLVEAETPSLLVDPFQARLVQEKYLIFYRKLWLNQKLYLQGFVVELKSFFAWAMEQSFLNSDLVPFAKAQLDLGKNPVTEFDPAKVNGPNLKTLFKRELGYPLNRFSLSILAGELPRFSARSYLDLFTVILIVLVTGGLYLIYRSAAAAVALSQKRQDFVSAVTHELKTPLTSIRMYSEMLEDGWVKDTEKQREYYRHLSKESGRLSGLIDNVLQLARLEKQTYKLQMKRGNPAEDFDEWARELTKLAEARSFRFHARRSEELPPISYDPEALKQVLLILLDNSMKFSAESDKTLDLNLQKEGDSVVLAWGDRGPGIPKAELKKVFEKFYRVENELTRKTHGTGIGLAMAKIIVESMGAKIEAVPREGGGLLVRIIFAIQL